MKLFEPIESVNRKMSVLTKCDDVLFRCAGSVPGAGDPLPAGWSGLDHHWLLLDLQLEAAARPRVRP